MNYITYNKAAYGHGHFHGVLLQTPPVHVRLHDLLPTVELKCTGYSGCVRHCKSCLNILSIFYGGYQILWYQLLLQRRQASLNWVFEYSWMLPIAWPNASNLSKLPFSGGSVSGHSWIQLPLHPVNDGLMLNSIFTDFSIILWSTATSVVLRPVPDVVGTAIRGDMFSPDSWTRSLQLSKSSLPPGISAFRSPLRYL